MQQYITLDVSFLYERLGENIIVVYLCRCACAIYITMFTTGIPPVITAHPMDTVIQLFTNFTNHTLTCEADGALSYRWERQNDVIPSDSTGVNTNTLALINLQPEDAGNYRCVAVNVRGTNKSSYATVTVSGKM